MECMIIIIVNVTAADRGDGISHRLHFATDMQNAQFYSYILCIVAIHLFIHLHVLFHSILLPLVSSLFFAAKSASNLAT